MRMALPATLQAVEEFFVEFRRRSRALMDRANCFAAELLVREALTNAVMHGCGADPNRRVRCSLRLKGRSLLIVIQDDGNGFDWRSARRRTADITDYSGRGMEILRRYADRLRYNDAGNVVSMIKRI
jgi:anti-sigma regulatory factor (Ser/Thr protein kinase)